MNVTAALVLRQLMEKYKLSGTLKVFPGVAEELLGTKAFYVRAGLFKDVDIVLGSHVDDSFATNYGQEFAPQGLVSVQYAFHGKAAKAVIAENSEYKFQNNRVSIERSCAADVQRSQCYKHRDHGSGRD